MTEIGRFTIEEQLPSLNEYVNQCRSNPHMGNAFKRKTEAIISHYIKIAKCKRTLTAITVPCEVHITWFEKDFRRDADNIQSAQKFIFDSLQKQGIIVNDNRKYIQQIHHTIEQSETKKSYVEVTFIINQ